jgi:hypothetical protein
MTFHPAQVIGGNRAIAAKAVFAEASLIASVPPDGFGLIPTDEPTSIERLSSADVDQLVRGEEAFRLQQAQNYRPGQTLWLLRKPSAFRSVVARLKTSGALIYSEVQAGVLILLLDAAIANEVRDEWAEGLYGEAWDEAMKGDWKGALRPIELMWLIERNPRPIGAAFYSLVLERLGRQAEADSIITVEANSGLYSLDELENTVTALAQRIEASAHKTSRPKRGRARARTATPAPATHIFRDEPQPAVSFDVDAPP